MKKNKIKRLMFAEVKEELLREDSFEQFVYVQIDSTKAGSAPVANLTFHGGIGIERINQALDELMAHPSFVTDINACYDYRDAILEVSMRELEAHVEYVNENRGKRGSRYRLAFLSQETLNNGLLKVYAMLTSSSPVEVEFFTNKRKAMDWLSS